MVIMREERTRVLTQFGEYIDTCVKVNGRWMVEERKIDDWPA